MPQPSDSHVSHSDLVKLALRDLSTIWEKNEGTENLRRVMDRVFPALVTKYGTGAAGLAKAFFQAAILNVSDAPAGSQADMPVAGPKVPDEFVEDAFVDSTSTRVLLDRGLRKFIGQAATDVIDHNFELFDLREKWARDPGGSCCAYCAMLAGRGFVYNSEASARRSGHVQKGRVDHCSIISSKDAARAYRNGYDPNALYARYNDAAGEVEADGLDVNDATVANRMRDMFPDDFTDGHAVPSILGDVDAGWPRNIVPVTPGPWRHILKRHAEGGDAPPPHFDGLSPYEIAKTIRSVVSDPSDVFEVPRLRVHNFVQVVDGLEVVVGTQRRKNGTFKVLTAYPPFEERRTL